jgi:MFS family permease
MGHRQILEVLVGLLAALFTAILSSTIVSNALPTIIADLEGTQTQYTWIVTASLLAMTVSTPVWGKLSDLYSKKALVAVLFIREIARSRTVGLAPAAEPVGPAEVGEPDHAAAGPGRGQHRP